MARLPRLTLPGVPHHAIQRGNNRQAIFIDDQDRRKMLALMADHARQSTLAVHAYVLMDNHFHLLATPATAEGFAGFMQAVGRGYVRYFNDRHGRSGTLWEGRYRSTLLEPARHLIGCMVYMDTNPVRAGVAALAADHPWSSCRHYLGQRHDPFVTPHPLIWKLGNTPFEREAAYAERLTTGVTTAECRAITDATLHGWALGSDDFLAMLQQSVKRRVVRGAVGRPSRRIDTN